MAEPLKNQFGPDIPARIGVMIEAVYPDFDRSGFVAMALDGYEQLELKERGRHIALALRAFLPSDFPQAASILVQSLGDRLEAEDGHGMAPFLYFPHTVFVHDYGVDDWEAGMQTNYELTQRFTAEFSIRPFIERYPKRTLAQLMEWTTDASFHVRRLVSEGTRPRLPWASRLPAFQTDPSPVLALLERLKDDPVLYVRRSVANNLNDIGKDNPDVLIRTAKSWWQDGSDQQKWVVKHGLRSLIKEGNSDALAILGYGDARGIEIRDALPVPAQLAIGESVQVGVTVANTTSEPKPVMVDFRIHYVKANGKTSAKVFKMNSRDLAPGEEASFRKRVSLKNMTTRTHYPGQHRVELQINGEVSELTSFELTAAD